MKRKRIVRLNEEEEDKKVKLESDNSLDLILRRVIGLEVSDLNKAGEVIQ